MTAQHGSGSSGIETPKTRKDPSAGQEISAPEADGGQNGKTQEALSIGQESSAPASGGDRSRLTKMLQTVRRAPIWAWAIAAVVLVVVGLPLLALVGVLGDESADRNGGSAGKTANPPQAQEPVDGSFVGKLAGTNALISVVIAPAADDETRRALQLYVADGRRESHSFSGSISENSFVAKLDDGDIEAKGEVREDSIRGTVMLDGESVRFRASRPAGAAGLYELTLSPGGKLRGASAAGLGVTGRIDLAAGTGVLKLADGRRMELQIADDLRGDVALRPGEVRMIVLPDGEIAGAGRSRPAAEDGESSFFIRSAAVE
jgi:hypothetical protein